jgi:hypothetical protein
MRIRSIVSTG